MTTDIEAFRHADARRGTPGGDSYWPRERRHMRCGVNIRERMVEDMRDILKRGGAGRVITADDLVRRGWTTMQVHNHLARATEDLNASLAACPAPNTARQTNEVA